MGDPADQHTAAEGTTARETTAEEQLRTISFRLRELQRLFAMRVEQENRRLEADGLDPVDDDGFRSAAREE